MGDLVAKIFVIAFALLYLAVFIGLMGWTVKRWMFGSAKNRAARHAEQTYHRLDFYHNRHNAH
jgi:hypothetical protein